MRSMIVVVHCTWIRYSVCSQSVLLVNMDSQQAELDRRNLLRTHVLCVLHPVTIVMKSTLNNTTACSRKAE